MFFELLVSSVPNLILRLGFKELLSAMAFRAINMAIKLTLRLVI